MQNDFFYKLFRTSSEPLSFYRNKANDVFSFDDAMNIMIKRYNTPERQARVHTYLKSLRFTSFGFDEKLNAFSTLTALISEISKLSPMGPPQYQGEVHAVENRRNAVLGETWANDVLRVKNPQTISFSDFGTNLHRALLLRDELNPIAATHNLGHGRPSGRYRRACLANTVSKPGNIRKTSHSWMHLVGSERWDGQRRKTQRRKRSRSGRMPSHLL
jgi:hypothetical protein